MSSGWSTVAEDPLVSYLRNKDGLWGASTSPFFDPDHLSEGFPDDEFGPLAAFLRQGGRIRRSPTTATRSHDQE